MNEMHIDRFIALVELDTELSDFENQKKRVLQELEQYRQASQLLDQDLKKAHDLLFGLKKQRDAQELELKSLDDQQNQKVKKLSHISNPREYTSLEHEIEQLKQQKSVIEEHMFVLWSTIEQAEHAYASARELVASKKAELEIQTQDMSRRLTGLENQIAFFSAKRPEYLKGIDQDLLNTYLKMKESLANPVVKVHTNSCPACFVSLTQQDMALLRASKIITCKNCFRMLYVRKQPHD